VSPYATPEWSAFVVQIRATPADRVTTLVAADWLEDHGKAEHARFIRGCVRISELRGIIGEGFKTGRSHPNPGVLGRELFDLVNDLRPLINRHAHEWTAGYFRKFSNPTVYDWPRGFIRACQFRPLKAGSDREGDPHARRKLAALLARQPVELVYVEFPLPSHTFAPPTYHLERLALEFRGVSFRHNAATALCPVESGHLLVTQEV
jgi:uncharacterized protein (TIGR02996 family)